MKIKKLNKAKGKRQISKGKTSALFFIFLLNLKNKSAALLTFAFCLLPFAFAFPFAFAQAQEGFATSILPESKVWFALQNGILSETFYPNLKTQNVSALYFIVTDGKTFVASERDADIVRQIEVTNPRALSFRQISTHPKHKFTLTKNYCAYPDYSTVLMDVDFRAPAGYQLYVVFDPALANTKANDTAVAFGGQGAFSLYEGDLCAALIADKGFAEMSVTVVGANDGVHDLTRNFRLTKQPERADKNNVLCVARIKDPKHFMLALAFADTPEKALVEAEHCLEADFKDTLADYEKGWSNWLQTIGKNDPALHMAAMLLQAHQEK